MRRHGSNGEWCRFLDARSTEEAVDELRRKRMRLDHIDQAITCELKLLGSSPSAEIDEVLRVARSAVNESIELLDSVVRQLRLHPDEVA